jgi:hypothetical protein
VKECKHVADGELEDFDLAIAELHSPTSVVKIKRGNEMFNGIKQTCNLYDLEFRQDWSP